MIEPVYIALGSRLRVLRIASGFDKTHVASCVGISREHVNGIEEGHSRFSLHYVEKFAELFGLTPEDLMKGVWL